MKFSCEKHVLQNAISIASRAVPSKSPNSVLEGLLISAGADGICITGYDLKKAIYTNIEANVSIMGRIVVNARLFGEMIRRMPEGMVRFESDELNVHVVCGKSEFKFIGMPEEDFPELSQVDELNEISIPQKILKNMINQTIFAVADNDVRPIYTGSLFEIKGDELIIVSVDGYRLAKRSEKIEEGRMEDCSFVVPGSSLTDIEKICTDSDELVSIAVGARHISFTIGDTVVLTRRLEGEFLNYRKSIPESFKYELVVDRAELLSCIERVAIIVSEKNSNPIRMTVEDGSIYCLCVTPLGKAEDTCLCEGSGEGLEIGFNDRYLTDALKAASGNEKLKLCLSTPSSPCIFKACDESENFTYMILPVRLRAN